MINGNFRGSSQVRLIASILTAAMLIVAAPAAGFGQGSAKLTQAEMSRRVDELLNAKLEELGWAPAENCSDSTFLRRAFLDLTGTPPTAREVLDFVELDEPGKREALIDRLLLSPTSATHLGQQWTRWMSPEDMGANIPGRTNGLQNWLRERFADNLRYDRLVADLLVATGSSQAGPSGFFVALEGKPEKIAAKTARVFMGVQLDCAECHDHPFDDWSQEDFWGFAAYFAQLSIGGDPAMMAAGQVADLAEGEVTIPDTEQTVAPKPLVDTGYSGLGRGTRRQQLTLWLTARENPFLARATVNRVWALLFGQGLIEPIDDMRSLDMASHPKLLGELSDYFADTNYDLRNLIAMLAKTEAYRRSTIHTSGQPPEASYAAMATKPLTEQQIANTLSKVAREIVGEGNPSAGQLANQLGKLRGDGSEAKLGIVSALVMLHGDNFDRVSRENSSRLLKALEAPYLDEQRKLRWLFLATLNRLPTQEEQAAFSEVLNRAANAKDPALAGETSEDPESDRPAGESTSVEMHWQSDLLWALLNSTEFAMTP